MSADSFVDHADCGCQEYNDLSRRNFIVKAAGAAVFAGVVPEWVPRVVMADSANSGRDVIVNIFMRGGADGLSLCAPFADPNYGGGLPWGHFSWAALILPYVEQQNLYNQIDFTQPAVAQDIWEDINGGGAPVHRSETYSAKNLLVSNSMPKVFKCPSARRGS